MNKQVEGIPFLSKPDLIRKYLPPLPATPKGRMKRPRTGLCSTREKVARKREVAAMRRIKKESKLNEKNEANNIFCFAALADKQTGTMLASFFSSGSLSFLALLVAATSLLCATFFLVLRRPVLGCFIRPFGVTGDGGRYFLMRSGLDRNGMLSSCLFMAASIIC